MSQLGFTFDRAPERHIFSVGELTAVIRGLLEDVFGGCWVSGEISNCRRAPSGHYYFTLKDSEAQLKCVCFRQNALYLKVKPQDGLEIVARGRLSVYEARGEYQLYVEAIEPRGYGALQLAFEQLKKKLDAEGLFDDDRKRPLPRFPRRVGIVTSPSGAAIADMVRILERRCPGLHIRLYPAQVQGEAAAGEIVRALRWFSESGWPDVVIAGRGGGSLEDLWAFNEEAVARAIAECAVPVVSAVGHQTDFTIADFVADLRAPTPSAAAELVAPSLQDLQAGVRNLDERLTQAVRYRLARSARRLVESGVERPAAIVRRRIQRLWQRNDELDLRLRETIVGRLRLAEKRLRTSQHALAELDLRVRLARQRARLDKLSEALAPAMRLRVERAGRRLDSLDRTLASLSPVAILERGYAIVSDQQDQIVRDASAVDQGQPLQIRLHRGRLRVRTEQA
ncbi:MAG: exodeoxyribonuclease VII large subunit, partial [Acidobacteria bacterium]|nr:exodeoxyribonuclease VII large subunit [Acidobacteriota bacterium]